MLAHDPVCIERIALLIRILGSGLYRARRRMTIKLVAAKANGLTGRIALTIDDRLAIRQTSQSLLPRFTLTSVSLAVDPFMVPVLWQSKTASMRVSFAMLQRR